MKEKGTGVGSKSGRNRSEWMVERDGGNRLGVIGSLLSFFPFSFFFSRSCCVVRVCACVSVSGPGVEVNGTCGGVSYDIDPPQFFKPVFA